MTLNETLAHLRRVRQGYIAILDLLPGDRLEWSPGPELYGTGKIIRHVCSVRDFYNRGLAGEEWGDYSETGGRGKTRAADLAAWLRASQARTEEVVNGLKAAQLLSILTPPARAAGTVSQILVRCIEHETHHKGQLTTYLRLMGVTPPDWYAPEN